MGGPWGVLLVYSPAMVFGLLFIVSLIREPRQFRNAIWLLLFLTTLCGCLFLQFGTIWMLVPIGVIIALTPLVVVVFLVSNTIVVARHEGVSMATMLPAALAVAVVGYIMLIPVLTVLKAPVWALDMAMLVMFEGLWFFASFVALLLYSWLYRMLPRRRHYDYIIIHGAGLNGDRPTPLLKGRIDRAVTLWERQGRRASLIVSGGQGADEIVSEAEAMRRYLVRDRGIPESSIIMEDRSTTTLENLRFSKRIMDERSGENSYRAALVTSDYHVFRASEYARVLGLRADGVGSHTKGYYWPAAFIREFIAISRSHMWPYYVIAGVWVAWSMLAAVASMVA